MFLSTRTLFSVSLLSLLTISITPTFSADQQEELQEQRPDSTPKTLMPDRGDAALQTKPTTTEKTNKYGSLVPRTQIQSRRERPHFQSGDYGRSPQ